MKIIFTVVALLASSAAFAMPSVGDYAKYTGTASMGAQSFGLSLEQEVLAFDGTNYSVKQTQTVEGQGSQSGTSAVPANQMVSDALVAQIMSSCQASGGHLENVTVPAGTFSSCAYPLQGDSVGTAWITSVPFGIAKIDETTSQGAHIVLSLATQKSGH